MPTLQGSRNKWQSGSLHSGADRTLRRELIFHSSWQRQAGFPGPRRAVLTNQTGLCLPCSTGSNSQGSREGGAS